MIGILSPVQPVSAGPLQQIELSHFVFSVNNNRNVHMSQLEELKTCKTLGSTSSCSLGVDMWLFPLAARVFISSSNLYFDSKRSPEVCVSKGLPA